MIEFSQKGDFSKTFGFLDRCKAIVKLSALDKYGRKGVALLKDATPIYSGETAESWDYEIRREKESVSIIFTNSNVQNGVPVVILIQYGHATRNGGFVVGRDFINPTIQPLFDEMANDIWKEVTK
jgi:hypothetical protein